jgi:hypothetical protein
MRVMFWNICAGGGRRARRIAARLIAWGPDVVALCEYRGTPPSVAVRRAGGLRAHPPGHHRHRPRQWAAPGLALAAAAPAWVAGAGRRAGPLAEIGAPSPLTVGVHVPNRVDAFRHLRGAERAFTWYSPNGWNGFRLDQAFVNRALLPRVKGIAHDWGWRRRPGRGLGLSDHAAVLLDLGG